MGPFPHDAPPARISKANPAGTDGFEFVEFAHQEAEKLSELFQRMGYMPVARHKTKNITVWRQGDINYVLNAEPGSHAMKFVDKHGPCAASMAWRVVNAKHAFDHAVSKGATPYEGDDKALDVPAIVGIGGSLLYFIEKYGEKGSAYDAEFEWLGERDPKPEGVGFYYLDHLTHNVYRGNMDKWWDFYRDLFGFKQIHFFDIDGRITGLVSRAITSPCGKIRIPLNESKDETSQIAEYLKKYNGEGIQHIAVGTDEIYDATDRLAGNGLKFMPGPPDTYYERSHGRVNGHDEPIQRMKTHGILIDGEGRGRWGERQKSCCRSSRRPSSARSSSNSSSARATKGLAKAISAPCSSRSRKTRSAAASSRWMRRSKTCLPSAIPSRLANAWIAADRDKDDCTRYFLV